MTAARIIVIAAVGVSMTGCGHAVKPTDRFRHAAAIPTPADITATQAPGAILLSWSATPDVFESVDGWNLYRKTSAEGAAVRLNASLLRDVQYRDADVTEGQSYYYSVRSVSPAGVESRGSHDIEIRYDSVPPAIPEGLIAAPAPNAVRLAWNLPGASDFGWHNVYRDGGLLATRIRSSEYADVPVAPGRPYVYEVTAVDDRGNESARSAPVSVTPLASTDSSRPGSPGALTLSIQPSGIRLDWTSVTDADLAGYVAYRRSAGVTAFARAPGTGVLAETALLDEQVQHGTTYEYAVAAVDSSGNESDLSPVASLRWEARRIDTGGNSLGSVYPWCGIAANSGRMQFLVPATDLNRSGVVDTIGLWIRSGAAVYGGVTVALSHTPATSLTADFAANRAAGEPPQTVYGPASIDSERDRRGSILGLPLSEPFAYDGSRSLLVEIAWNGDDGRTVVFGFEPNPDSRLRLWQQPDGGGSEGHELNQQFLRFSFRSP